MPRAFPPAPSPATRPQPLPPQPPSAPRPLLARAGRDPDPDPDTPTGRAWAAHVAAGRIGTPVAPQSGAGETRDATAAQFRRLAGARR